MINKDVVLFDEHGGAVELETIPEQGIVPYNEDNLKHLEYVAAGMERFVGAQQKIQNVLLKLAKPGDWVIFGETACLSGPGTERIAAALGISFSDFSMKKDEGEDKNGKYFSWTTTCKARFGTREIEAIGQCGTRNKFFGYKDKAWKQIEDVDEQNIKMASRRNAMKEGVRILLGLRNIPIEELKTNGVKFAYGYGSEKKVEFKKTAERPAEQSVEKPVEKAVEKPAQEDSMPQESAPSASLEALATMSVAGTPDKIREQIGEMLLAVAGGNPDGLPELVEKISRFKVTKSGPDQGKIVSGKRDVKDLTEKQLFTCFGKAKKLLLGEEV